MSWICLSFLRLHLFSLQSSVFLTILILLFLFYIVDAATISINFRLSAIIVVGKVFIPPSRSYRRESVDEESLPLSRQTETEKWNAAALRPECFTINGYCPTTKFRLRGPCSLWVYPPKALSWRPVVENFMKPRTTHNVFLISSLSLSLGTVFVVSITVYS